MSPMKKITVGVLLFALGWTLQHYYVSRVLYAGGQAMEETSLEANIMAEIAEETRDDQLVIALEMARGIKANQSDIQDAQENIDDVREDLYESDETIEEQVDAEIAQVHAVFGAITGLQGALTTTAFAILLKIIGMFLAITACASVIVSTDSGKGLRISAMVIALLAAHVTLTDRTSMDIAQIAGTGTSWMLMARISEPMSEGEAVREMAPDPYYEGKKEADPYFEDSYNTKDFDEKAFEREMERELEKMKAAEPAEWK